MEKDSPIYRKSIVFDPDKGFLELPVVQKALAVLLCICIVLTAIIVFTAGRSFQFDVDGLSNFASLFRVPVGAFTLSLPIFALLAASHRSEQTKQQMALTRNQIERTDRQIQIATDQGRFSNYYKHLEEFLKYCDVHFTSAGFAVAAPRKLHAAMYPNARQGDLHVSPVFLRTLDNDISDLHSLLKLLGTPEQRAKIMHKISVDLEELLVRYNIKRVKSTSGSEIQDNNLTVFVPGGYLSSFIIYQLEIIQTIDEVLAFDAAYVPSHSMRQILNISKVLSKKEKIMLSDSFDFHEIEHVALTEM